MNHKSGKLIAIEGGDGSGKKTQTGLLLEYLAKNNIQHQAFDFPRYESFYGKLIARFLRGEFGELNEVSPYFAAMLFALDRLKVKNEIVESLNKGSVIITNRYIPSNIAHQGGKFENDTTRDKFINWIENLEYNINGLPREDAIIYLKIPIKISKNLINNRSDRSYLKGNADIQENDEKHRLDTEMMYNILSQKDKNWIVIECVANGRIKSKEEIHLDILKKLQERNII